MSIAIQSRRIVNGVDTVALKQLVEQSAPGGPQSQVRFGVSTSWRGGAKSETHVEAYELAGRRIEKDFSILIDEPRELCGSDAAPNPQEMLMAAFNACMVVGYVAGAAVNGIELDSVVIETSGELDLRGFLGLDANVKPGYERLHYTVRIKGDGTREQFQKIHETVMATSPNRWNIANPIKLSSDLIVE